jgi:hypothetical protein
VAASLFGVGVEIPLEEGRRVEGVEERRQLVEADA